MSLLIIRCPVCKEKQCALAADAHQEIRDLLCPCGADMGTSVYVKPTGDRRMVASGSPKNAGLH